MAVQLHQLKPGDHIYTDCPGALYKHHGIYEGKAKVFDPYNRTSQQIDHAVIHFIGYEGDGGKKLKSSGQCKKCFYKQQQGIVLTCIHCFLDGNPIYRYEYGVSLIGFNLRSSGSCTTMTCDKPDTVLKRANDYWCNQDFGEYSFVFNNCEHFATKCKTGTARCNQVLWGTGVPGAIVYDVAREFTKGLLW